MKKNFTYMKYSPEKMHTAENRGGKYTQGKQTNTPKMKHAKVFPLGIVFGARKRR